MVGGVLSNESEKPGVETFPIRCGLLTLCEFRDKSAAHEQHPLMSVGGQRPGAGRRSTRTRDSARIRVTVLNVTRVKLERVAKEKEFKLGKEGTMLDLGRVIDFLCEGVQTKEPEYLRLAREAQGIPAPPVNG